MSAICDLLDAYRANTRDPVTVVSEAMDTLLAHPHTVIHTVPLEENLQRLRTMADRAGDLPLFGIPFVIKDNIDLAGHPTTAACPGYSYTPERSATAVQRLLDAGAIPLAKVNLDQFATGLVGTRSPYGTPLNPLLPDHIPGGSSSGSAVAVAIGAALFALGTDTAGSGRVPAAACNIVGLKPSKGRIGTTGVVPACRSLDCVSVFATSCHDASRVLQVLDAADPDDAFSRTAPPADQSPIARIGRLAGADLQIDDPVYGQGYERCLAHLDSQSFETATIAYGPFAEAARLLYGGPWVAERTAAVGQAIADNIDGLDPIVSNIIQGGQTASAIQAFEASYSLAACRRRADAVWQDVDALLLPTIPGLPTLAQVAADPVGVNTRLGTYTNFVNLLDCCAVTIPVLDQDETLASVTFVAPAWREDALLALAAPTHAQLTERVGAGRLPTTDRAPVVIDRTDTRTIAVVGAHLRGQPLNHQLTELGARFAGEATTASTYRLVVLPDGPPHKPGLIRLTEGGTSIAVELWDLPLRHWGAFVSQIPAPLGIGSITLSDGSHVQGFLCESYVVDDCEDISDYGGWLAWLDQREAGKRKS